MKTYVGLSSRVSIHAFREGRRRSLRSLELRKERFNPRLPRGKATIRTTTGRWTTKFQSTPSAREGDRVAVDGGVSERMFQSTPSAREGDSVRPLRRVASSHVSIHAFREGRRPRAKLALSPFPVFQSTPSAREGDRRCRVCPVTLASFNPRLPRGKATRTARLVAYSVGSFNPRLPRGKATQRQKLTSASSVCFNPRLPRGKATRQTALPNSFP